MKLSSCFGAVGVCFGALLVSPVSAFAGMGQPSRWQVGLQDSATPIMDDITSFHDFLLWVIAAISAFVIL